VVLHFSKSVLLQAGDQLARQVSLVFKSAQAAGVLKGHCAAKFFKCHLALADFLVKQLIDMGNAKAGFNAEKRVVMLQRPVALGAGGHQLLDAATLYRLNIEPGKAKKIFLIA